jgi:hypothetical protein
MGLKKEIVAYHEAGHVVADHYQCLRIRSVSVLKNEDTAGRVEGYKRSRAFREAVELSTPLDIEPRYKDRLERECRSLLAGTVAQRRFAPRSVRAWQTRFGRQGDLPQVEDMLVRVTNSDREVRAYFKLLKIQTEDLITHRWPHVEAIATALVTRLKLRCA